MSITKVTSEMIESVAATKVTNIQYFDDNDIVNDLSTLALRQASNENKSAYSTSSMYVDVFQDSSGITGLSDTERNESEYMRAWGSTSVPFNAGKDYMGPSTFGLIQLSGEHAPQNLGTPNISWVGDSQSVTASSTHNGATVARAFSTRGDFKIRVYPLNAGGVRHGQQYPGYTGLFIRDETYARTNASPDVFKVPGSSTPNALGMPLCTAAQWASGLLNPTYAAAQGVSSFQNFDNTTTSFGGAQQNFNCNGNGFRINGYKNDGSTNNYGLFATYTASNNELLCGVLSSSTDHTQVHGHAAAAVLDVPNDGIFLFNAGDAGSGAPANNLWSYGLIHANLGAQSDNYTWDEYPAGSTISEAVVAAGSFESNAITTSSAITSMGAVITYQDFSGTNTLNTDIIMKLSADGGVTYSTATLVAMPDFSSGIKMAKVNDLAVTSGTALKYKIEFANQVSGSKEARIRGVSLQY